MRTSHAATGPSWPRGSRAADRYFTLEGQRDAVAESLSRHAWGEQVPYLILDEAQAVLIRNGFEQHGYAPRYLSIAGRWQDHLLFQRLADG